MIARESASIIRAPPRRDADDDGDAERGCSRCRRERGSLGRAARRRAAVSKPPPTLPIMHPTRRDMRQPSSENDISPSDTLCRYVVLSQHAPAPRVGTVNELQLAAAPLELNPRCDGVIWTDLIRTA